MACGKQHHHKAAPLSGPNSGRFAVHVPFNIALHLTTRATPGPLDRWDHAMVAQACDGHGDLRTAQVAIPQ